MEAGRMNSSARAQTLSQLIDIRLANASACIIDAGIPVSWSELARQSKSLATGLAGLGIGRGDRVGLWLPNRSAWLATLFACARLGAIAVSINTRFRSTEVGDLLRRSGARALVYWPGYKLIDFAGILDQCGSEALGRLETVVLYSEDASALPEKVAGKPAVRFSALLAHAPMLQDAADGDTPCIIFTTSGTTKAPKLVVHKQRNVLSHGRNVAAQYGLAAGTPFLLFAPFCGVYGFCSAMAALSAGSPLVLEAAWDPARYADLIEQHGITHFTASNEAIAQLFECRPEGKIFPSLQLVVSANLNPAHADIAERGEARGVRIIGLYGSSEVQACFSHCEPNAPAPIRGRAGGIPASALAKVRTRDPETQRLCAAGEPGELEFFAPESGFVEYFEDPAATRSAFTEDGYFKSGDLGKMESDGSFTYLARMGDTLRLGGFLVSPAEIEAVVQEHAAIESCQIVGARTKAGVKPVAFVIARGQATVDAPQVIEFVAQRLAKYKVPVKVVVVEEFPTTPSANGSKVQKTKLRDMAETMLGSGGAACV